MALPRSFSIKYERHFSLDCKGVCTSKYVCMSLTSVPDPDPVGSGVFAWIRIRFSNFSGSGSGSGFSPDSGILQEGL